MAVHRPAPAEANGTSAFTRGIGGGRRQAVAGRIAPAGASRPATSAAEPRSRSLAGLRDRSPARRFAGTVACWAAAFWVAVRRRGRAGLVTCQVRRTRVVKAHRPTGPRSSGRRSAPRPSPPYPSPPCPSAGWASAARTAPSIRSGSRPHRARAGLHGRAHWPSAAVPGVFAAPDVPAVPDAPDCPCRAPSHRPLLRWRPAVTSSPRGTVGRASRDSRSAHDRKPSQRHQTTARASAWPTPRASQAPTRSRPSSPPRAACAARGNPGLAVAPAGPSR